MWRTDHMEINHHLISIVARELKGELAELLSRECSKEYYYTTTTVHQNKSKHIHIRKKPRQSNPTWMLTISVTHSNKDDHCILYHFCCYEKKHQHRQREQVKIVSLYTLFDSLEDTHLSLDQRLNNEMFINEKQVIRLTWVSQITQHVCTWKVSHFIR